MSDDLLWHIDTHTLPAAFALLCATIDGAAERSKRPATPHHVTPLGAARIMADKKSSTPPVHHRDSSGTALYEKACAECGKVSFVDRRRLDNACHSCAMKARATHGLSGHPLYKLLKNAQARCWYPSASHYEYYGGRGITVCDEWTEDPRRFVEWALSNGWRPGRELDRKDADKGYSPDNCRFVTHRENSQTTRRIKTTREQAVRVRQLLRSGSSVKEAAAAAGVSYMVAWHIKNSSDVWRDADEA